MRLYQPYVVFKKKDWPSEKSELPELIKPYWDIRDELSTYNGLVYKGLQLVIPSNAVVKVGAQCQMFGLNEEDEVFIVGEQEEAEEGTF